MKIEDKLIVEKAPPDTSTYLEGEPAVKEEGQDVGGIETFPFVDEITEARLDGKAR